MSKSTAKNQTDAPKTFDAALGELERLVQSLEQGDTPLEELMQKYEQGMKLHAHCQRVLQDTELRIEQLRATGEKTPITIPEATDAAR
ncbi:MAG: exodeoxyribonuclease VII small subunit [Puniceicoccales bacterium]|jgi:exodeoxyribonuclease VII small subunit|nr:exodeoxyribonuclease VII small subunit [Puniceicoccales bacterium]